jgi:hypothetical protein
VPVATLPYAINAGDVADASKVQADLNALLGAINGGLDTANVTTAAALATGRANAVGVASTLARSDHTHAVNGSEALTADPATGNFVGRRYFNTSSNVERMCINAAGAGTWITVANMAAADLPAHASRHASGGGDDLSDGGIVDRMMGRPMHKAVPAADVTPSAATWTDFITLSGVVLQGVQTVFLLGVVHVYSTAGAQRSAVVRIQSRVGGGAYSTIHLTGALNLGLSGAVGSQGMFPLANAFSIGTAATATTWDFKVGVYADAINVTFDKTASNGGDTGPASVLTAVVG